MDFFLDSGAFSAYTKGVEIDIKEYCNFIKEHQDIITHYAVLDVIGSAEGTLKNQRFMEEQGLHPIPCYHYGEDTKYLEYYVENYDYVAIGGMVPVSTKDLLPWLDSIFAKHICDDNGYPRCKIHGFGLTTISLMVRYPWYSVDSTTWALASAFGEIFIPSKKNNKYDYTKFTRIGVSEKHKKGKISKTLKNYIEEYLEPFDISWGNETQKGIINNSNYRSYANLIFFQKLEAQLNKERKRFKYKKRGLF